MRRKSDVGLEWALFDDELHHISEFVHLPPRKRPLCFCPVCGQQIILKLGPERIFHAAHKSTNQCIAQNPETALHYNAKFHIYQQLRKATNKALFIYQSCIGWNILPGISDRIIQCNNKQLVPYIQDWDEIAIEYYFEGYRPDIVLLRNGEVIGVIEVFVTHAIEPEKECMFSAMNIPWVEVTGNAILGLPGQAWRIEQPIPWHRLNQGTISPSLWQCSECSKKEWRKHNDLMNPTTPNMGVENKYQRTQVASSENDVLKLLVADIYYPSGIVQRKIYRIKQNQYLYLMEQEKVIEKIRDPNGFEQGFLHLIQGLNNRFVSLRDEGAIVDIPMGWQNWPGEVEEHMLRGNWLPRRYRFTEQGWKIIVRYENLSWDGFWENRKLYLQNLQSAEGLE